MRAWLGELDVEQLGANTAVVAAALRSHAAAPTFKIDDKVTTADQMLLATRTHVVARCAVRVADPNRSLASPHARPPARDRPKTDMFGCVACA